MPISPAVDIISQIMESAAYLSVMKCDCKPIRCEVNMNTDKIFLSFFIYILMVFLLRTEVINVRDYEAIMFVCFIS